MAHRLESYSASSAKSSCAPASLPRESVEELRALGEVSQAVNSTLDLETVLDTIVTKAVQLSGTDAGTIYVFDEESREFQLRATYGMSEELIASLKLHHTELSAVARALDRPTCSRAGRRSAH